MPSNMELISGHTLTATRMSAAATLAAALINAAGRRIASSLCETSNFRFGPAQTTAAMKLGKRSSAETNRTNDAAA